MNELEERIIGNRLCYRWDNKAVFTPYSQKELTKKLGERNISYDDLRDFVMSQKSADVTEWMTALAPALVYEQNIEVAIAHVWWLCREDTKTEWQEVVKTLNRWKQGFQRPILANKDGKE